MRILLVGLILSFSSTYAKDFGIKGHIFAIKEQNLIIFIKQKLFSLNKKGELKLYQDIIANKIKNAILEPKPLSLQRAKATRIFYYKPEFILEQDIYCKGKLLHAKGTKITPLKNHNWRKKWVFFNAKDNEQLAYIKNNFNDIQTKLILTSGRILDLMDELNTKIYFDQSGFLTKKFGIKSLPAIVEQEEDKLKITEVCLTCV